MSYVYPPAGSIASRIALCLLVVVGQSLTLFPLWVVWYISYYLVASCAGIAATAVVTVVVLLSLVAVTYPIVIVATLIVERLARTPTFFSPSLIAQRTSLGLFVGFCVAGVLLLGLEALPPDFIPPEKTPAGFVINNLIVAVFFVVIISSSVGSTWMASKRHVDSL